MGGDRAAIRKATADGRAVRGLAVALVLVLGPVGLPAQQGSDEPRPLVSDRPDFTESSVAVAPGRIQVEAGYTFTRSEDVRVHDLGEGLVRVGVVPRVELRIGVSSFAVRDGVGAGTDSGLRDLSLGAKLALPEPSGRSVPKAALLVGTKLPTGSEGFGARGLRPGAILALGWDLAERLGFGVNAGYAYEREEGRRVDELSASGAVSWDLSPATGLFAEYFGVYRDGGEDENFLSGGATWLLGPDLQLDGRAGIGLDGRDPDYFAGVGIVVRR